MPAGAARGIGVAPLVVGLLLVTPVPGILSTESRVEAASGDRLVITTGSASPTVPFDKFDGNPPKLYDVDGDGREEIIAQNDNQWVYVFDSRSGELLFEVKTALPDFWGARSFNGPEVSIVSEGGATRLIIASSAAIVSSYRFLPGSSTADDFEFAKEWQRRLDDCHSDPGMDAKPVLADLNRDGRLDILGATEESGLYALRADGTLLWRNCLGGGNAAPAVADLNRDGFLEVVHVSDGGTVAALNGRTGGWIWGFNIRNHVDLGSGSITVQPGIGQLDGEGGPDVVAGARDSHNRDDFDENHAVLFALSSRGRLLWANQDPDGNPLTYTRPIVVDADRDGRNEVYWGDWNTMGHKPPPPDSPDAWAVTGPAHYYRFAADGERVWRQTLNTYWSNKDLALADVTGNGVQNVLANGPGSGGDGIWYLDARNGNKVQHVSTHPWKVSRGAVVSDLWGTGTAQWVVQVEAATDSVSGGAILVHDTGVAFDAAWPHLPDPTLRDPPPPPDETSTPTFRIKSPNAWWQEVHVDLDGRTVTDTKVRVDGGDWLPMTLRSWGAWTSSYNTPAGSRVEFRATAADGTAVRSEPFTWLDGTLTRDGVPADGEEPSPFTATFDVSKNVNEWWVEVKAGSSVTISSMDVRVDGSSWISLSKTNWGTWAKSFHVPEGSTVEFRATSTAGQTAVSQAFTWLDGEAPPPTGFSASFSVSPNVNNWWVEVTVKSSSKIASVHATVDGGDPVALSKTSWGTWAKSFHVPTGAEVRFQASDGAGTTVTSDAHAWP